MVRCDGDLGERQGHLPRMTEKLSPLSEKGSLSILEDFAKIPRSFLRCRIKMLHQPFQSIVLILYSFPAMFIISGLERQVDGYFLS